MVSVFIHWWTCACIVVRSQLLKDDVARELGDLVTVFSSRVQEYVVALDGQKRKVAIATESTARFILVRMIQSAWFFQPVFFICFDYFFSSFSSFFFFFFIYQGIVRRFILYMTAASITSLSWYFHDFILLHDVLSTALRLAALHWPQDGHEDMG